MNKKSFLIVLAIVGVFTFGFTEVLHAALCSRVYSLSPSTINFGSVTVGDTSSEKTVTITNDSVCTATITAFVFGIEGTDNTEFSITGNNCTTIDMDEFCTVTITFNPATSGKKSASLSVDANEVEPLSADLIGNKPSSSSDAVEDDSDDEDGCGSIGNAATHKGRNNRIIPPFLSLIVMTMIPLGFILFFRRRRKRL